MAAAIVRLHIIPGTAAITVILATRTTATTQATTATAGEVFIGLGGAIAITAGIMAGGRGTGGAADTAGMAADGTAADGTAIIDSESRSGRPSVLELCLLPSVASAVFTYVRLSNRYLGAEFGKVRRK